MEIYLIRHPRIKVDKGVCYGQSDIPLADTFLEEAALLKSKLPATFDVVYSSPAQRCLLIARMLNTSRLITDDRLRELDFGAW